MSMLKADPSWGSSGSQGLCTSTAVMDSISFFWFGHFLFPFWVLPFWIRCPRAPLATQRFGAFGLWGFRALGFHKGSASCFSFFFCGGGVLRNYIIRVRCSVSCRFLCLEESSIAGGLQIRLARCLVEEVGPRPQRRKDKEQLAIIVINLVLVMITITMIIVRMVLNPKP